MDDPGHAYQHAEVQKMTMHSCWMLIIGANHAKVMWYTVLVVYDFGTGLFCIMVLCEG